jgi:hypothetical protein
VRRSVLAFSGTRDISVDTTSGAAQGAGGGVEAETPDLNSSRT